MALFHIVSRRRWQSANQWRASYHALAATRLELRIDNGPPLIYASFGTLAAVARLSGADNMHDAKADTLRAEYNAKADTLRAEYDAKADTLWAEYHAKAAPLRAEYDAKADTLWAEYHAKKADTLWAEYHAKTDAAPGTSTRRR